MSLSATERALIRAEAAAARAKARELDAFLDEQEAATRKRSKRQPEPVEVSELEAKQIEQQLSAQGVRLPRRKP